MATRQDEEGDEEVQPSQEGWTSASRKHHIEKGGEGWGGASRQALTSHTAKVSIPTEDAWAGGADGHGQASGIRPSVPDTPGTRYFLHTADGASSAESP